MGPPSSGASRSSRSSGCSRPGHGGDEPGPEAAHWIAEAGRLAFADRALYLADPEFVSVPVKGLIDPGYIRSRAGLVEPGQVHG